MKGICKERSQSTISIIIGHPLMIIRQRNIDRTISMENIKHQYIIPISEYLTICRLLSCRIII